ncbi:BrnT family toxin [Parahaliea maris]|uniref:BrnT family toxin n=1 Tax=Parahaliea maris TaxID=2716870 RepID=A0A5C9A3V0_9GAMM|nr:BrnT family toxin [Parahaliea maris]TXS95396.1 BrnT family toxin [Parahaliea maris]
MKYSFEWDPEKAARNLEKHSVGFEQAVAIFKDPMALSVYDSVESAPGEDRWATMGTINGQHYLVVIHSYYEESPDCVTIRVISARHATKTEVRQYEQGNQHA